MTQTEQLTIRGALARASDPATSHEAARLPRDGLRRRILEQYGRGLPLTDVEASNLAGIEGGWKRCSELRKLGLIVPCGTTVLTNPTRRARLCRITSAGIQLLNG